MVEFALVLPVLAALILGILEYGNAFRQVGSIERAAQQGARTASSQANGRFADYEALQAIQSGMSGLSGVTLDRVVIYDATGRVDGEVPPNCLNTSSSSLRCNRYTGGALTGNNPGAFSSPSLTNPSCASGSADSAWCPTTRSREVPPGTQIGVHITATYEPVTGIVPSATLTIERYAVYQIEPCAQGQTSC